MVVGKVWIGYEALRWVRRAWDLGGGLRVDVKGEGIVSMERMGMEGLICVSGALVILGVEGLRWV